MIDCEYDESYLKGFEDGHKSAVAMKLHHYDGNILKIEQSPATGDLHLIPCPFCASTNVVYWQYETPVGPRWRIACLECMAMVDPGYAQQRHQIKDTWNRRDGA